MIIELLELFWRFFKIGLFTIGGGYAMIPLIKQQVVGLYIDEHTFLNMLAVAEATPGPFAVNLSTFIGMQIGTPSGIGYGYLFAVVALIAVTLPSFVIMLLICSMLTRTKDSPAVNGAFALARPVVLGLILAAAVAELLSVILPNVFTENIKKSSVQPFDYVSLALFAVLMGLSFVKIKGRRIHPILLLVFAALMGIVLFAVLDLGV